MLWIDDVNLGVKKTHVADVEISQNNSNDNNSLPFKDNNYRSNHHTDYRSRHFWYFCCNHYPVSFSFSGHHTYYKHARDRGSNECSFSQ